MKPSFFSLSLATALLLLPASAAEKESSALGKQMTALNDAFKAFRRETDPLKGAAQARDAQQAALKSAAQVPELIQQMPDGPEKTKALLEFHQMIGKLYLNLCAVEEAFLNGKIADVTKIVNTLKDEKKTGHDKFMKEEKP